MPSDLQAAYDYYARNSAGAADRSVATYVETRDRIIAQPRLCRERPHGWRQAIIPRFPGYAIFYKEKDAFWLIAAIVSTIRDPDHIMAALLIREAIEHPE